jgi:hypothetical protein
VGDVCSPPRGSAVGAIDDAALLDVEGAQDRARVRLEVVRFDGRSFRKFVEIDAQVAPFWPLAERRGREDRVSSGLVSARQTPIVPIASTSASPAVRFAAGYGGLEI